jgi:uncharacterized protein involved in exopolysaccharide biosynthesis
MTKNVLLERQTEDEIDLRELFYVVWQGKWVVVFFTVLFAISAVFYALNLPNIYKSEVLLAPVSDDSGLKIPGQLGGLAALAGVNLGSGSDKIGLAIEIMKSRQFIGRFIEKHDLFIPVMASEDWNRDNNLLQLDPAIYNRESELWVREVEAPFKPKPSLLETHEEFMRLFSISQDKGSGMISMSVEHYSPYLAQQWATWLVLAINDEMRQRDLIEAQNSITYLNEQINQTNIADVRTTLFSLIEDQTKTIMLANVREEYVFKTVDPAVISEKRDKPSRALIVIMISLLGGIVGVFGALLPSLYNTDKPKLGFMASDN